jgi:type II secretory pathway pseudopilin PulG
MAQGFCPHCSYPLPPGSTACPHCGKPVAAGSGDRGTKVILGVLLGAGCLLVLVAVAGIVAALFIPNFLDALQRAKQKRTLADMRTLAVALESFHADRGAYPGGETIDAVVGQLGGHGWPGKPATDGWGHPLRWGCWESEGDGCVSYELVSPGRDGVFEPTDAGYDPGAFPANDYDADIVLSDGMFSRWPEGTGRLGAGG